MKICTRCKEERSDELYYSYWHSTQQKYRIRHVCNVCTRQQSRDYKLKRKNMQVKEVVATKFCVHCKEDVPVTGFYEANLKAPGSPCISCRRKQYEQKKYNQIMENGGSERVPPKPNVYTDQFQKAQTFMILEMLGWTYNDNGVWSKEGVKSADNVWVNIIPQPKRKRANAGLPIKKKHGVHNYIPQIIKQKEDGMTYADLAYIYDCSHTTIRMIVNKYYREK